jgi:hypothetical protein
MIQELFGQTLTEEVIGFLKGYPLVVEQGRGQQLLALGPRLGQGHLRPMSDTDYPAVRAPLDDPSAAIFPDAHAEGWCRSVKMLSNWESFDSQFSEAK